MLHPEMMNGSDAMPVPPVTPLVLLKSESLLIMMALWETWLPALTSGLRIKRLDPIIKDARSIVKSLFRPIIPVKIEKITSLAT